MIVVFDGVIGKWFFGIIRVYVFVVLVYIDYVEWFFFCIMMFNDVFIIEVFIN